MGLLLQDLLFFGKACSLGNFFPFLRIPVKNVAQTDPSFGR